MSKPDGITTTLCTRDDGHATDLALMALVDGEDELVPAEVTEHVDQCDTCTERLAEFAFAVVELNRHFQTLQQATHRFPVFAVALGALVGLFSTIPFLLRAPGEVMNLGDRWATLSFLLRGLRSSLPLALDSVGPLLVLLSYAASGLLFLGGLVIAQSSAPGATEGGRS